MPGVLIRDADHVDLDGLSALEDRAFATDRMSRRSLGRLIGRASARLRVAEAEGGAILGYYLVLLRRGSRVARLYSIAVDRGSRGNGLGGRLLADAEAMARRALCAALRLEVRPENRPAIAVYEEHGFRRIGEYPAYYADGADALRYEKTLAGT